jgi:hypothetical protein
MVAALKLSDIPDTLRERHGNLRRLYKGLAYALGWVNADSKRERSIPPQAGKPPPPPYVRHLLPVARLGYPQQSRAEGARHTSLMGEVLNVVS